MKASIVAVLFLGFWATAHAGSTVYTCKTEKGTVYQDRPCATIDATISSKVEYAPRPCGSSCGATNGNSWAPAIDRGNGGAMRQEQMQVQVESVETPSGYRCSGNGKTWIQPKPCPDSVTVYRPVSVSGNDQYGNHFEGGGTLKDQAPVNEEALSHDELCKQVHEQTPTTSRGKNRPSDSYERNKIRQQEGC